MIDPGPRQSFAYFPSRQEQHPEGHAFLLARDISLGIMPLGQAWADSDFAVDLSAGGDAEVEFLARLLDVGRPQRFSAKETVVSFVEEASNYIGYFGEVYFELLRESEEDTPRLMALPPGRVRSLPRFFLQQVPKADQAELERRFARLPRERMFQIGLPAELGSPRTHRRLLRQLANSSASTPDFAMRGLGLGQKQGYEFSAHRAGADRRMEELTRRWGSVTSLQRPVAGSSEFFFLARRLAFNRAQALLREHIMESVNRLLERLGRSSQIIVSGLPTAKDLTETGRQLHSGEVSFADALAAWKI